MKLKLVRGISLALALCMVMSVFTGTAFAVTGTMEKQATFQEGFEERGSISGTGFNNMQNTPVVGNPEHEPYLSFYNWKAATGMFGKSADDIALQFISQWENQGLSLPASNTIVGWNYPTNPWTQHNIGIRELGESDRVHISFEYARESGASSAYMQFRTYTNTGGSKVEQDNSFFSIRSTSSTSEKVSIFGETVDMTFGTWHQFDYIIYPKYNTGTAEEPVYAVAADLYFDGECLAEKKIIYTGMYLTGIDGVRVTYDPRKVGDSYPLTNTYIDNYSHEVFTADDPAPVIAKTELTHTDVTLNSYIDNENRRIDYYGQTVDEMLDDLQLPAGATAKVVDKSGQEISGTEPLLDCYVQITKSYGDGYYGGHDYYSVRNMKRLLTGSSMVEIDFDTNTIPDVYLYTMAGALLDSLTLEEGATAKVVDASGSDVDRSADIADGMKIVVTKDTESETYTFGTVHGKAVDLDFDGWSNKYYYGGPTNNYNGTWFGGSPLKDDAGVNPEDVAYVEYVEEPGRGTVMHVYSNSDYTRDYNHINIFCNTPTSAELGTKFVMEMSAKVGAESTISSQVKYTTKSDPSTSNFLNPIRFTDRQITVMNTIVKEDCVQGNWYDVKAYCDTETGRLVVFVDGEEVFDGTNTVVQNFNAFTDTRVIQHFCGKDQIRESWVDDFRIYGVGGLTDSFLSTMDTKLTSEVLTIEGSYINGYAGMSAQQLLDAVTVSQGATKTVYTSDGQSVVTGGTPVEQGMIVTVISPDGSGKKNYILNIADAVIGDILYKSNGVMTNGKFAAGTFEASVSLNNYVTSGTSLALVIAQYEDNELIKIAVEEATITQKGEATVTASMDVEKSEGTTMSIMLLDGLSDIRPLKNAVKLTPFSSDSIETVSLLYPGYVSKAVTFSYDDLNPTQDRRFIEILNENGLKGTFNLKTANFINKSESVQQSYVEMYEGHEVANHTRNHLQLRETDPSSPDYLTLQECEDEILNGQNDIAERFGVVPEGLVWPFSTPDGRSDYNELLAYIRTLGVKYIRPVYTTYNFNLPTDWYDWRPTCHHDSANNYLDSFLALPNEGVENVEDLKLFYIWGHTYEFDEDREPENTGKMRWDGIEELCQKLGEADIWSATNLEIYNYVEALKQLQVDKETNLVTNPTDVDLYIQINGINTMVPAHGVAGL